jgi:Helicase associated domain
MFKRKGGYRYLSASPEAAATTPRASDQFMATKKDHEDAQLLLQAIRDNTQPVPRFRDAHQGHAAAEYDPAATQYEKDLPNRLGNESYGALTAAGTNQELAACLVAMSRSTESPTQASTISTTTTTAYESDEDSTRQGGSNKREREYTTTESEGESEEEEDDDEDEGESPRKLPKLEKDSEVRDIWEDRYKELVAFKREFGHANPRVGKCPSLALAQWLKLQRQVFRNDLLDSAQTQLLRALGCEGFEDFQKYNHTYPTSKPKKAAKVKNKVSSKPLFRNVPEGPPNIPEPNKNDVVCGR